MNINIRCPCGQQFSTDQRPGTNATCPACGRTISLPRMENLASASTTHSTKIQCGCGYTVNLDAPPGEDYECPNCGAPLGRAITQARREGPDVSSKVVMTQTKRTPMPLPPGMAAGGGLRFGIGTVLFLLAAAVGITLLIVKILSSR